MNRKFTSHNFFYSFLILRWKITTICIILRNTTQKFLVTLFFCKVKNLISWFNIKNLFQYISSVTVHLRMLSFSFLDFPTNSQYRYRRETQVLLIHQQGCYHLHQHYPKAGTKYVPKHKYGIYITQIYYAILYTKFNSKYLRKIYHSTFKKLNFRPLFVKSSVIIIFHAMFSCGMPNYSSLMILEKKDRDVYNYKL